MYDDTADFGVDDTAEILNASSSSATISCVVVPAPITLKISACLNPPRGGGGGGGGGTGGGSIPDSDDWIVLERTDGGKFHVAISVKPTTGAQLFARRPYVTIYYHSPISPHKIENFSNQYRLRSDSNRIVGAVNGELRCNDNALTNSKGSSCGGPYVDDLYGVSIGLHIYGASSYSSDGSAIKDNLVDGIHYYVPVGLHFGNTSTLVSALRTLKILA